MTRSAKPSGVLMPVPTAVPPRGSSATRGSDGLEPLDAESHDRGVAAELLAEHHRGGVHQVRAAGLHDVVELLGLRLERRREVVQRRHQVARSPRRAATWIEVGKVSLLDWLALTWSLGWISTPARAASEASTSFMFMLERCRSRSGRRRSGTASTCSPLDDLRRRRRRSPRPARRSMTPSSALTRAAAALTRAIALMCAGSSGGPADREVLDRALGLGPPQRVLRAPGPRPCCRARCGIRRSSGSPRTVERRRCVGRSVTSREVEPVVLRRDPGGRTSYGSGDTSPNTSPSPPPGRAPGSADQTAAHPPGPAPRARGQEACR